MPRQDYSPLITRLEREHAVTPEIYRLKLLLLALLGLAYPGGLLALSLGGLAILIQATLATELHLALPALLLSTAALFLLLPLAFIRPALPAERRLSEAEAPKLFALIGKIQAKVRGTNIESVMLSSEFELYIQQTPRLGILGRQRNTLVVGLPLLQMLSRKEFAGLLCHELEHIRGIRGKFSAWIYRLRQHWGQIQRSAATSRSPLTRVAYFPLQRFIPYFEAFSFVMARQNEYLADSLGGQIVGKRSMADALISSELSKRFLEEQFWPNFWVKAESSAQPAFPPHSLLRTALAASGKETRDEAWLDACLKQTAGQEDPHPSLNERLLALDQRPELPPRPKQSAAQLLIGQALPELLKEFDTAWLQQNTHLWETRHQAIIQAQSLVSQFSHDKPQDLLAQDQCRYGMALHQLGRDNEAKLLLKLAADSPQGNAQAAMVLAQILHETGDETTIHYLELAMRKDARLAHSATAQAARFYQQHGNRDKAETYWLRLSQLHAA